MLGMLFLLTIALAAVGTTLYTVVHAQTDQRIEAELKRAAGEFHLLATEGIDPDTGAAFTDPDILLEVNFRRTLLGPTEGVLGYLNGGLRWKAPDGVALRPENDPALLATVKPLTTSGNQHQGTVTTDAHQYAYIVVPVRIAGNDSTGALVRVINMGVEHEHLADIMTVYLLVSLGTLLVSLVIMAFWVRRLLHPITQLRNTAERITEEDLSERVPIRSDDELGALTATVNQMLDRIESGVQAQRALLDDVGHELRTPVTVVRGHLELMDADDPDDVAEARSIAVAELDRMGGLVTDLITLAKAGQPDFIRPRTVALADLTDSVATKAKALGDRRWSLGRVADADVWLDPDRVTQAWLQLAANAVQYSDPYTPIQIGSRVSMGEAYLWVADRGIGINPEELQIVRARFGRAAGVRGKVEGSGLGLSIVESIATAHRGRLDIDSEPGFGSTFTIVLPLTAPDRGEK